MTNAPVITEPTNPRPTGTARVVMRFTVNGEEREFCAQIETPGSDRNAYGAAMKLTGAVFEDAKTWLHAQPRPVQEKTVMVRYLFTRQPRTFTVARTDPTTEPEGGAVAATVEVNGEIHEYSAGYVSTGDPYRACVAALATAKDNLWDWAYTQRSNR